LSGDCSGYLVFRFTGCQARNVCRRGRRFVLRPSSKDALPRRVLTLNERFCPTKRRSRVFLRPLFRDISNSLIADGARVIIHDDVLATGGTVEAISKLVEQLGGEVVGACFILELTFLEGRERLNGTDLHALIAY
jgi:predicted amidophosphoribosyltransferase